MKKKKIELLKINERKTLLKNYNYHYTMLNTQQLTEEKEKYHNSCVNEINVLFSKLNHEDVEILTKLYIQKRRFIDVCDEHYMSEITLKRHVNRILNQ